MRIKQARLDFLNWMQLNSVEIDLETNFIHQSKLIN